MLMLPTKRERWLANNAQCLALGVDVLYHGTRYRGAILRAGALLPAPVSDVSVCFTRSALEAAYWAMLPRDDDEGIGSIFVLQRNRIRDRVRVEQFRYSDEKNEFEERVLYRPIELKHAMVGLVSEPIEGRSGSARSRARKHTEYMYDANDWD